MRKEFYKDDPDLNSIVNLPYEMIGLEFYLTLRKCLIFSINISAV